MYLTLCMCVWTTESTCFCVYSHSCGVVLSWLLMVCGFRRVVQQRKSIRPHTGLEGSSLGYYVITTHWCARVDQHICGAVNTSAFSLLPHIYKRHPSPYGEHREYHFWRIISQVCESRLWPEGAIYRSSDQRQATTTQGTPHRHSHVFDRDSRSLVSRYVSESGVGAHTVNQHWCMAPSRVRSSCVLAGNFARDGVGKCGYKSRTPSPSVCTYYYRVSTYMWMNTNSRAVDDICVCAGVWLWGACCSSVCVCVCTQYTISLMVHMQCIHMCGSNTLAPNSWRKPNLYNCLDALPLF